MFLHILTEPEKSAFLALASRLIGADADRADAEVALLAQLKAEMGIEADDLLESKDDITAIASHLLSHQSRVAALFELVGICHVDADYSAVEHDMIRELGRVWEITEEEIVAIENWVLRLMALMQQAKTLLDGEK